MSEVRIVVLQRGWVMVGRYSEDGTRCHLSGAKSIRRWGTTRGLGEIAPGPTKQTTLDEAGEVDFHALSVVLTIRCDAAGWAKHLGEARDE
jgi:hypothetical protein